MSLIQEALEKAGKTIPETLSAETTAKIPETAEISKSKTLLAGAFIFLAALIVFYLLPHRHRGSDRTAAAQPAPKRWAHAPFQPKWVLSGVTISNSQQLALVNDQVVGVGETIGKDAVVKEIDSRSATLEFQGRKIRLTL